MIKQLCGRVYAIGGTPDEIIPLHWSLYNWNVLYKNAEYKPPLDLGDPQNFLYFLISKDKFFDGRSKALSSLDKNTENGKETEWGELPNINKEWDNMPEESFLEYGDFINLEECET